MSSSQDNTNIYLGMEACRPGSDDLELPEMSHVAEAVSKDLAAEQHYHDVQRSDAALASAFRDVEAPTGLQDRLLTALAAEKPEATADAVPSSVSSDGRSKRMWLTGALAASIALALGIGVVAWNWSTPLTAEAWVAAAVDLHDGLSTDWQSSQPVSSERPIYSGLRRGLTTAGWQQVHSEFDREAVAYRLVHPRGSTATLLVFRPATIDASLPLAPPNAPSQRTSRLTTGIWTSDGLVYALVVDGGREQYQSFLRSGAVAILLSTRLTLA